MRWLEVELTVTGELAEPIAELLARYGQGGVALSRPGDGPIEGSQGDDVQVRAYLADDPDLPGNRQAIERGLWHLGQIQAIPEPTYRFIEDQDWSIAWKANYQPLAVGKRLMIQPSWLEAEPSDRRILRLDPGMAFGTGTHPTTLLCLELLEDWVQPGDLLVDLGCGSGILSIAALLLGAGAATGYDISDQAVEATSANALANDVADRLVVKHGSLNELIEDVRAGLKPDLVVANILAPILTEMLGDGLADVLPADTPLILSGILDEQAPAIRRAASSHGLQVVAERAQRDWLALVLKHIPSQGAGRDDRG